MAIQGAASLFVLQIPPYGSVATGAVFPSIQLPAPYKPDEWVDDRVAVTGSSSTTGPVNAMQDKYLCRLGVPPTTKSAFFLTLFDEGGSNPCSKILLQILYKY